MWGIVIAGPFGGDGPVDWDSQPVHGEIQGFQVAGRDHKHLIFAQRLYPGQVLFEVWEQD